MKRSELTHGKRLIVAADFLPIDEDLATIEPQIMGLATGLASLGVGIKLNTGARVLGYHIFQLLKHWGLCTFADWKLFDIKETLEKEGMLIWLLAPDYVTVALPANVAAMRALKSQLAPETALLGVGIPTTWTEEQCKAVYDCDVATAQLRLMALGAEAGIDGFICAPAEVKIVRRAFGPDPLIICPNVRFKDAAVKNDDQNLARSLDPGETIDAGADGIVMGRPITGAPSFYDASCKALELIRSAL